MSKAKGSLVKLFENGLLEMKKKIGCNNCCMKMDGLKKLRVFGKSC